MVIISVEGDYGIFRFWNPLLTLIIWCFSPGFPHSTSHNNVQNTMTPSPPPPTKYPGCLPNHSQKVSRKYTEHLKRYSWFSGWNGPKFVFSFFKAIFDTNFRLSWPFFSDSGTKFNRTEYCLPFTQTMKGPVYPF